MPLDSSPDYPYISPDDVRELPSNPVVVCIDGRRTANLPPGAHCAGGILGVLSSLLGGLEHFTQITDEIRAKVWEILLKQVGGLKHTTHHSDEAHFHHSWIGCGYLARVVTEDGYEISSESQQFIQNLITEYEENNGKNGYPRIEVLHGTHQEQYIAVLRGTTHTIVPSPDGGPQRFVVTPDIAREIITHVVRAMLQADTITGSLNQEEKDALLGETMKIHYLQLCAIVSAIAPELPLYEVNIENSREIRMVKINSPELEDIITSGAMTEEHH